MADQPISTQETRSRYNNRARIMAERAILMNYYTVNYFLVF